MLKIYDCGSLHASEKFSATSMACMVESCHAWVEQCLNLQ